MTSPSFTFPDRWNQFIGFEGNDKDTSIQSLCSLAYDHSTLTRIIKVAATILLSPLLFILHYSIKLCRWTFTSQKPPSPPASQEPFQLPISSHPSSAPPPPPSSSQLYFQHSSSSSSSSSATDSWNARSTNGGSPRSSSSCEAFFDNPTSFNRSSSAAAAYQPAPVEPKRPDFMEGFPRTSALLANADIQAQFKSLASIEMERADWRKKMGDFVDTKPGKEKDKSYTDQIDSIRNKIAQLVIQQTSGSFYFDGWIFEYIKENAVSRYYPIDSSTLKRAIISKEQLRTNEVRAKSMLSDSLTDKTGKLWFDRYDETNKFNKAFPSNYNPADKTTDFLRHLYLSLSQEIKAKRITTKEQIDSEFDRLFDEMNKKTKATVYLIWSVLKKPDELELQF